MPPKKQVKETRATSGESGRGAGDPFPKPPGWSPVALPARPPSKRAEAARLKKAGNATMGTVPTTVQAVSSPASHKRKEKTRGWEHVDVPPEITFGFASNEERRDSSDATPSRPSKKKWASRRWGRTAGWGRERR